MKDAPDDHSPATDTEDRPDFLVTGWSGFIGRLVFVLSFLALMVLVFLAMTGLWNHN